MQVVGAGPHVDRDQGPEVHDRQAVGIDRSSGLLRHEVIHDAEKARGQEKAHRIVPVPPLHHRIDGAAVDGIGFGQRDRYREAVDDMQNRDGEDERAIEPVRHVDMRGLALHDGAEEHDRIRHPDHGDQDIDRPFEFRVLLGRGIAQRQRDRGQHDHQLPAPEHEGRKPVGNQPRLAGALHHVQRGANQRAAAKGKDHRVGVQRAQAPETEPRQVEIQHRKGQLPGDEHANQHADHPPDNRHDRELANHRVVVRRVFRSSGVTHCAFQYV